MSFQRRLPWCLIACSAALGCAHLPPPTPPRAHAPTTAEPSAERHHTDRTPRLRIEGASIVRVSASGALTLDARVITEDELVASLRQRARETPERLTVVSGDPDARFSIYQVALQVVARASTERVIAATPDLIPISALPIQPATTATATMLVSLDADEGVRINSVPVSRAELVERVRASHAQNGAATVLFEAPATARFERVAALCDVLHQSGAERIFFVVPPAATGAAATGAPAPDALSARAAIRLNGSSLGQFFPDEARDLNITSARVTLSVTVEANGAISDAVAVNDPGFGFAQAAVRSMTSGTFTATPARDREGRPVRSVVRFTIAFEIDSDGPPPRR